MNERLPINFHQTFIPERKNLSLLLETIEESIEISDKELSKLTGIPMGESSGKLPSILAYAKGMDLITISKKPRVISLTNLGDAIKEEDLYITEDITQWILHLNLCRASGGSELWFQIFNKGIRNFIPKISREKLESYLQRHLGPNKKGYIGIPIATYTDPAALSLVDILKLNKEKNELFVHSAPLYDSYSNMYSYFFLYLWENSPSLLNSQQLTINYYNEESYLFNILNFNKRQQEIFLANIENTGAIRIDKHMSPWIVIKKMKADDFVNTIYDLL